MARESFRFLQENTFAGLATSRITAVCCSRPFLLNFVMISSTILMNPPLSPTSGGCMIKISALAILLSVFAAMAADSVTVTPVAPTSSDTIHFSLSIAGHCCVTTYSNKTVSLIGDTAILLSYVYHDSLCSIVKCLVAGSTATFSSVPFNPGTYSIYELGMCSCYGGTPGAICNCPMETEVYVGKVTVTAAPPVTPSYPYYSVSPARPILVGDTVRIEKVLGISSNPCCLPAYQTSYTLQGTPIQTVPTTIVAISYAPVPVNCPMTSPGIVCPITAPAEYGPTFTLAGLNWGHYIVVDGQDTAIGFDVVRPQHDTVIVKPSNPTTKDSLVFNLYNASATCVDYFNKSVIVGDTTIVLNEASSQADCILYQQPGEWTQFTSAPLKAGSYGIYKSQTAYCQPNQICPGIIVITRVGHVRVFESASTVSPARSADKMGMPLSITASHRGLVIAAAQPMHSVNISAYTVDGRLVMETRGVELRQGFNVVGCTDCAIGGNLIIVSVKSANAALRTMVRVAK
jgi:hypothetical protein